MDVESAHFDGPLVKEADLQDGAPKSRKEVYKSLAASYVTDAKAAGKSFLASLWSRKIALLVMIIIGCLFTPLLAELSSAFKPLRWTAYFTLGVVILLVTVLTLNLLPTHVAFAYALGILVLFGCVNDTGALQGFSNKGANTVAVLYIVSFAVTRTNGMALVFRVLLGSKPLPLWNVLIRLCIPLGGLSVFLNNTPIYQAALPEVLRYCHANDLAPSKLLIPVAFAIIFGGTVSLIGTSTNLVVSGLAEADAKLFDARGKRMKFTIFGQSQIGILYYAVGVVYMVLTSSKLLPSRKKLSATENVRTYLSQLEITAKARTLIGKTIAQAGLRSLDAAFLVEIVRDGVTIEAPGPETVLREGDVLTFNGETDAVRLLFQKDGGMLPIQLTESEAERFSNRLANSLYEAVVSPDRCAAAAGSLTTGEFCSSVRALTRARAPAHVRAAWTWWARRCATPTSARATAPPSWPSRTAAAPCRRTSASATSCWRRATRCCWRRTRISTSASARTTTLRWCTR